MISFSFDASKNRRTATFSGAVRDAELIAAYEKLVIDPAYQPAVDDLIDLSQLDRVEITPDGLRSVVSLFTRVVGAGVSGPRTRLAIIAPDLAVFGAARMYELLRGARFPGRPLGVFRSHREAVAWLEWK